MRRLLFSWHSLPLLALNFWSFLVAAARDPYEVLGVGRSATESEIKKAYRQQSLRYHPDKNPSADAASKFAELSAANEILSDPEKREIYDREGEEGLKRKQQRDQGGGMDPFDDVFSAFGFRDPFGRQRRGDDERRTANVEIPLRVSLRQLYTGDSLEFSYTRQTLCTQASECEKKCPECAGPGVAVRVQQLAPGFVQQVQMRDDKCIARGKCWNKKCRECPNGPTETDTVRLTLEIQRGMRDGERITFPEVADEAIGHLPGDLIFSIDTVPHSDFERRGDDLHTAVDIPLLDALVGFSRELSHLDGHAVPIVRNVVTSPGEIIVLAGEGMPRRTRSGRDERGSLYVKFNIIFPKELSEGQRKQVRDTLSPEQCAEAA